MNTTTTTKFNYEVFDRQMVTLLDMGDLFIRGYKDADFQEKVYDIRSLCIKAARVCRMTDQDFAQQQEDLTYQRRVKNQLYLADLYSLTEQLAIQLKKYMVKAANDNTSTPENPLLYIEGISELMPSIGKWLGTDKKQKEAFNQMIALNAEVEGALKKSSAEKVYPHITSHEHVTDFLHFYNMLTYLIFHFQRMMEVAGEEITSEEAGRLLTNIVQQYLQTEEAYEEMRHYMAMLHYEYEDGMTASDIKAERKKLVKEVPMAMQTDFMNYADNLNDLGISIRRKSIPLSQEETDALLIAIAKYQWLSELLYQEEHPESSKASLYNKVFHTSLNGRPVDLVWLREKIGQMIGMASRKNHWFCIYSVLKYHNYIKDQTAKYFAEQMQHPDWFPQLSKELQFNGDTLTEYNGYLSVTNFTIWNQKDFDRYRTLHHKTKWSPNLWRKFQNLCYSMNEVFR